MTIADFDPRLITQYNEPRFLIHFQWGNSEKVYRYALVETMEVPEITQKTKQKKDETNLSQKEIWEKNIKNKWQKRELSELILIKREVKRRLGDIKSV